MLRNILDGARRSEWGRSFGADSITTVADFRRRVPVLASFDELAPVIDRIYRGESDVLFEGRAAQVVQTSGTTSSPKLVPVRPLRTDEAALAAIDDRVAAHFFLQEFPDFSYLGINAAARPRGQWLFVVGRAPRIVEEGRIPMSFFSGFYYGGVYPLGPDCFFTQPQWIGALTPLTKLYTLARLSVGAPIRAVSAFPDGMIELANTLAREGERLVRDVHDGTLSAELPPDAAHVLPSLSPRPDLARRLGDAIAREGHLRPTALWPELELLRTWRGGSMALHEPTYQRLYGVKVRELGYFSSEGHCVAFPRSLGETACVLSIHRQFYEFIGDDDVVYLAHELEANRQYRLVVTTPHGLYRYDTQDLVRVTAFEGGAPVLEPTGRVDSFNWVGEKLTVIQLGDAVKAATASRGLALTGYTVIPQAPRVDCAAHYELVVEVQGTGSDAPALAAALERELRRCNVLYGLYRSSGGLAPARVTLLQQGTFSSLRRHLLAERGDQLKLPVLWRNARPSEFDAVEAVAVSDERLDR